MTLVYLVIGLALAFDFINGFHDASNSIATVVSTRVLRPWAAVLWAAIFNMAAFFCFGLHVAHTIGIGLVSPSALDTEVLLSALGGAIAWDLLTWWAAIPTSSSHALLGGLGGAALAKGGLGVLQWQGFAKTTASIVLSPLLGFVLAGLLMIGVVALFFRATPKKADQVFRRLQLISAALYSLGHGGNDGQKTMGIVAVLLFSNGMLGEHFYVPKWVVGSCYLAMGFGTLFGGWRIVRTMGTRLTPLRPIGGFCAETAGALTLFGFSSLGIPVSTTHTITGGIIGVGLVSQSSKVRWRIATRIVWAWILTLPLSALLAYVAYVATHWALSSNVVAPLS